MVILQLGEGPWWHIYTAEWCGCILTVSSRICTPLPTPTTGTHRQKLTNSSRGQWGFGGIFPRCLNKCYQWYVFSIYTIDNITRDTILPLVFAAVYCVVHRNVYYGRAMHYTLILTYVIGQTIIFLPCAFYFLFFPRLISAVGDWMSTILPHIVWL